MMQADVIWLRPGVAFKQRGYQGVAFRAQKLAFYAILFYRLQLALDRCCCHRS